MKEMVLALCGTSLFCAFIFVLSPEGGIGRFVSLVASLLMLAVVFFSITSVELPIAELPVPDTGNMYASSADWLIEQSAREIGRSVCEYVASTYGYEGAEVSVTLDVTQTDSIRLVAVSVDLRHANAVRGVYEMEAELQKSLGCDVEVLVK